MVPLYFNPLPPRGGRRARRPDLCRQSTDFNPLPPRGGRHVELQLRLADLYFNPLPPRGGRLAVSGARWFAEGFQSTPSSRRETSLKSFTTPSSAFQSTPSSRRETRFCDRHDARLDISIHSLLAEGDANPMSTLLNVVYFNPLPPRGGRPSAGWT